MLPYFAAAGHHLCGKSAHVYHIKMRDLEKNRPCLFKTGQNAITRSDRYWAELSCDLVIVQTIVKSVKKRQAT